MGQPFLRKDHDEPTDGCIGGTTYCAIASLSLSTTIPSETKELESTIRWLTQRQIGGFQGRPGKLEDVCYSFWCGGALTVSYLIKVPKELANLVQILGQRELINREEDRAFLLSSQSPIGGFGKEPEDYPDPYHSYIALAALALHDHYQGVEGGLGLKRLDPQWNVSEETATWLRDEIARIKGIRK